MAWYTGCTVRYKGSLIYVNLRYGVYMSERVISGKRVVLGERNFERLLKRKPHVRRDLENQVKAIFENI